MKRKNRSSPHSFFFECTLKTGFLLTVNLTFEAALSQPFYKLFELLFRHSAFLDYDLTFEALESLFAEM